MCVIVENGINSNQTIARQSITINEQTQIHQSNLKEEQQNIFFQNQSIHENIAH